jgi:hypothetical protein
VYKNNFVCIALWSVGWGVECIRATDRKRLVIPILKLFYICVHEGSVREWYERVPWGDSLYARKFRDVIATPCVPFAISITFHMSQDSLATGHRAYEPKRLIYGSKVTTYPDFCSNFGG